MLFTSACVAAADAASGLPYKVSSCVPETQSPLRTDASKLAGRRSPEAAWQLINTFLCGSSPSAEHSLVKASAKVVIDRTVSPSGVEEKPVHDIFRSISEQLPHAKAWNTEVRLEGRDLVVYYSVDQYCWNFFGIRFDHGTWQLVLLGGGCD